MAENCQYCGGRLKKLHPAHEVFCIERPKTAKEVLRVRGVVRELFPEAVKAVHAPVHASPEVSTVSTPVVHAAAGLSTLEKRVIAECLIPETYPDTKAARRAYKADHERRRRRAKAKGEASGGQQ